MDRQIDLDRQTNRQVDRQTNRQINTKEGQTYTVSIASYLRIHVQDFSVSFVLKKQTR